MAEYKDKDKETIVIACEPHGDLLVQVVEPGVLWVRSELWAMRGIPHSLSTRMRLYEASKIPDDYRPPRIVWSGKAKTKIYMVEPYSRTYPDHVAVNWAHREGLSMYRKDKMIEHETKSVRQKTIEVLEQKVHEYRICNQHGWRKFILEGVATVRNNEISGLEGKRDEQQKEVDELTAKINKLKATKTTNPEE